MNRMPKRRALLSACVVVVLTLIVVLGRSVSSHSYANTSWEYKAVNSNVVGMGTPESGLNKLGMDGWELVQFIRTDDVNALGGTWIFKRPK